MCDAEWYRKYEYEALEPIDKRAVDDAFKAAQHTLIKHGLKAADDDRAEMCVGAIVKYIKESGN